MSDIYDLEQVRLARATSKLMARHVCTVDHPVFGKYQWLEDYGIYSDLLDQMLEDALNLLERHVMAGGGRIGEDE